MKWFKEDRQKITFDELKRLDSALAGRLKKMREELTVPPPEDHRTFRRKAESYMREKMIEYLFS